MTRASKLVSIASPALTAVRAESPIFGSFGTVGAGLKALLELRNGFYAFESALHVYPAGAPEDTMSLERWNEPGLWRSAYDGADGLFFAEDTFGDQFCLRDDRIFFFDAETGDYDDLAGSIEEWADLMLNEFEARLGYPLAHDWQTRNGAIPIGSRLVPKTPFVLGGAFDAENLRATDAVKGMRIRGDLARQIRDLPDGTQVTFKVE